MMASEHPLRAAEHAIRASELLELVERQELELEEILRDDPERHLELVAAGTIGRLNASRQWSVELAQGHALAAIALELSRAGVAELFKTPVDA